MIDFYQTLYVTIGIALWAILFLSLSNIIRKKITIITIFLFVCRMAAHLIFIFVATLKQYCMIKIFERGAFHSQSITDAQLSQAREHTRSFADGGHMSYKTTVFLSHKHSDLEDLKDVIGFLRSKYDIEVYIDSLDPAMPKTTSGDTARRIKDIISKTDRFILLATDDAIDSKWCNWELGYGDAKKYRDKICIFPIKEKGTYDYKYKGNEYMQIYPFIAYYDGSEIYKSGEHVKEGYYVCYYDNSGTSIITPLSSWLKK